MSARLDILTDYSQGRMSAGQAIHALDLDGRLELLVATVGAGLTPPRPPPEEVERQVAAAVPLLRAALIRQ